MAGILQKMNGFLITSLLVIMLRGTHGNGNCHFSSMEGKLNCLIRSMERLERRIEGFEAKVEEVESNNDVDGTKMIKTMLETLQETNKELKGDVKNLHETDKELKGNVKDIQEADKELKVNMKSLQDAARSGVSYVRWGRTTCPRNPTFTGLVYRGIIGSAKYNEAGSGSNFLCLTSHPEWNVYDDRHNSYSGTIWGTEHSTYSTGFPFYSQSILKEQDIPCAVCLAKRNAVLMIPGKMTCPRGWTKEYSGYLMTALAAKGRQRKEYVCMDEKPENIPGGGANDDGSVLYPVEARCGSLLCPPYVNYREVTCVVCTK